MAIMQALALLAGGAAGYAKRQKDDKDEARRAEDDAFRREQRDRQRIDWQRQDKQWQDEQAEKDAVKAAAAPTTVDDTPVAPPIGSRDEPRAPEDQGIRAAGQTFTDRAGAETAAAAYNAAPARMRRAAGAVSDPVRAGQLEASANTAEAGAMQMRAAKLKEADDAFNRDLMTRATSFDALAGIINESKGDGQAGALKVQVVPSPDGKTVALHKLNPDGTTTPTPFTFANTTEGLQQAVGIVGMRLPPEQKLAHMQGMAKTEEERRRWTLDHDLKVKDSETRGKREDRMARAAERQAAATERTASIAAGKAAAGSAPAPTGLAMKDADKFINEQFTSKDEATGKSVFDSQGAQAVRTLMLRMPAAQQGDTQGAVNQALTIYNQAIKVAGGDHDKAMAAIAKASQPAQAPAQPPAAPPAARPAAAAPAAAVPAPPPGQTRDAALNAVMAERGAKLQAAEQALAQVQAEGAAAMKSGDPRAVATYTQRIAQAQRARDAIAAELGR